MGKPSSIREGAKIIDLHQGLSVLGEGSASLTEKKEGANTFSNRKNDWTGTSLAKRNDGARTFSQKENDGVKTFYRMNSYNFLKMYRKNTSAGLLRDWSMFMRIRDRVMSGSQCQNLLWPR